MPRAHSLVGERPIGSEASCNSDRRAAVEKDSAEARDRALVRPRATVAPSPKAPSRAAPSKKISLLVRLSAAYSELRGGDVRTAARPPIDRFKRGIPCAVFAGLDDHAAHQSRAIRARSAPAPHASERVRGHHRCRRLLGRDRAHACGRARMGGQLDLGVGDRARVPGWNTRVRAQRGHASAGREQPRPGRAALAAEAVPRQTRVRSPASSSRPSAVVAGDFSRRPAPVPPLTAAAVVAVAASSGVL